MSSPLLADLGCGAGGASMGYHRAGFRVVGIDWMIKREMSQAIPPAYTEWLGNQLIEAC